MRRILIVLIIAAALIFGLIGCGDDTSTTTPSVTTTVTSGTVGGTDSSVPNGGTNVSSDDKNQGTDISTELGGGNTDVSGGGGNTDVSSNTTVDSGSTDVSSDTTQSSDKEPPTDDTPTEIPDGPIDIAVGGVTDYVVVYDDSDYSVTSFANKFVAYMKDTHGISFTSVGYSSNTESEHCIYIGDIPGAKRVKERMAGAYDFGACVSGDDYVLYATSSRLYDYLYDVITSETLIGIRGGNWSTQPKKDMLYHSSRNSGTSYVDYVISKNGGTFTYEIMLKLFEERVYKAQDGTEIKYRIYIPYDYTEEMSLPVLTILHGAGERGSDNELQMKNMVFNLFKNESNPVWNSIVVCPQCPAWPNQWVDTPWADGSYSVEEVAESNEAKAVVEILGYVKATLPTDENRYYVAGLSMGGFGTWDLIMRHSEMFAGAVALCGGADPSQAEKLVNKPIYAIHDKGDYSVPFSGTEEMVNAILNLGGEMIKYEYLSGYGHNVWGYAGDKLEIWTWLYEQTLTK